MIAAANPRLRNVLQRLRGLAATADPATVAQEMLDFLAMADGMKPVCLLGRGSDDPGWAAGVSGVAADLGLRMIAGPVWDVPGYMDGLPDWYVEYTAAELAPFTARYICRTPNVADEVEAICAAGGHTTMEQEARLLDYPPCCVAAHYQRSAAFHNASLAMLRRAAGGDQDGMRRLLAGGAPLAPKTGEEQAAYRASMAITPCPFTSFNMCNACGEDRESPAARISLRYARLARSVDSALYGILADRA